jgi:MtN3 and saliva related transmembrane protein
LRLAQLETSEEALSGILTPLGRTNYRSELKMVSIDLVGYLAATLTTAAFLPQVLQVWQSRSTKDLALSTLLSFIGGVSMWLLYGVLVNSPPIIIANAVTLVLNLVILRFKLKYG